MQPAPDELALRQDRIFVQLDDDYTGVLLVDGVEIPEDQTRPPRRPEHGGLHAWSGTETGALRTGRSLRDGRLLANACRR